MRRSRRKFNRRNIFVVLGLISLVGVLLPASVSGRLISLVQVIIPFQDWMSRGVETVEGAVSLVDAPQITGEEAEALRRANAALRHRLASLSLRNAELEATHRDLAGIRSRGLAGGKLIPARVVASDALSWRDSRLITTGALSGVRREAAVASNHFSIRSDVGDGLRDGLAVLAGEVLVGFVSQVGTHSARVLLLTDRQTEMRVRIARQQDGAFVPLDKEFYLVGTGKRRLAIHDIDHRYIKSNAIQIGDVVLSSSQDQRLPASLTVGKIVKIRPDQDNRLLYVLEVEPPIAPDDIHKVYVVEPALAAPAS